VLSNQFTQALRLARKSNGIVTKRRIASASVRHVASLPLKGLILIRKIKKLAALSFIS